MGHTSRTSILQSLPDMQESAQILDAPKSWKVSLNPTDVKGAVTLDPAHCAFAQACQRKGKAALVFRNVAYVRQSSKRVFKYVLNRQGKNWIKNFDKTGNIEVGTTITLYPPTGDSRVGGRTGDQSHGYQGNAASKKTIAARKAGQKAMAGYQRKLNA